MKNAMTMLALLLFFAGIAAAQELGSVTLPEAVTINGVSVAAGMYTVTLKDGNIIELSNAGGVVVSETAATEAALGEDDPADIRYEELKDDGGANPIGRIRISWRGTLYLVYCSAGS